MSEKKLDPSVLKVLEDYEAVLARFMDDLSPSLARYNDLLYKALPHNPKAHFYAVPNEGASGDKDGAGKEEPKRTTSPLLRRPLLDKAALAKVKGEAKEELLKRQSSFEECCPATPNKPIKAKRNVDKVALHETKEKKETKEERKKSNEAAKADEAKPVKEEAKPSKVEAAADDDDEEWEDVDEEEEGEEGEEEEVSIEELYERIAPDPMLLQQLRVIKKEAKELVYTFEQIHDWIALNVPALGAEDAEEGTAIMGGIIETLESSLGSLKEIYEMESEFLKARATLEVVYTKAPQISATAQLIKCMDNDQWDEIEQGYRNMMRTRLIVHSQLAKNMEVLMNPAKKSKHNFVL